MKAKTGRSRKEPAPTTGEGGSQRRKSKGGRQDNTLERAGARLQGILEPTWRSRRRRLRHHQSQAHEHTGTKAHEHTGTQAREHAGTHAHKQSDRHTGTKGHVHKGTQSHKHMHTGTQPQ